MSHTPANHAAAFDEVDPHGQHSHGQHDSHVIIGPKTLLAVLAFLLMFTALTVAFARFEIYIQDAFNIMLPWWVNVIGAMTIASIKSLMVMAYFMQLKYDNPINSVAMLLCVFCLCIFLAFTGLDLFTRGNIYDYKAGPVVAGGTGKGIIGANDQPVTVASMNRLKVQIGEADVRDYLIVADAIAQAGVSAGDHGDEAGMAASKALTDRANGMMDLKKLKFFSVPAGGAVSSAVKALGDDASRLRAGGKTAAADIVDKTAKSLQSMDLQKAAAAYSVDAMFNKLAAVAHGHTGHGHGDHGSGSGNTSSMSRSQKGLSGALDATKSHGTSHGHSHDADHK